MKSRQHVCLCNKTELINGSENVYKQILSEFIAVLDIHKSEQKEYMEKQKLLDEF